MRRTRLNVITTVVLALTMGILLLSGCNLQSTLVRGHGKMMSHSIQSDNFTGLNINGAYELTFLQSPEYSVTLEIQENLFQYVKVDVQDSVLQISNSVKFYTNARNTPRLIISAPDLNSLDFYGAVIANMDLNVDILNVSLSGAGDVTLTGSANILDINNSGAASIKTYNMISKDVSVSVTGAGIVEVFASDTLDISISGVSMVRYDGDPQLIQTVSGMGSIERRR